MRGPPEPILKCETCSSGPGRRAIVNEDVASPFVSFTVTVSKGKGRAVIVEDIWIIDEIGLGGDDLHSSIVDRPGIIVDENPDVGRSNDFEIAPFAKSCI